MAEISLDVDTSIREMDDSISTAEGNLNVDDTNKSSDQKRSKPPKSMVVKIPLQKLQVPSTSNDSTDSTVASRRKIEILKKAQTEKDKSINGNQKEKPAERIHVVPAPHPVPANYDIPRRKPDERPDVDARSQASDRAGGKGTEEPFSSVSP